MNVLYVTTAPAPYKVEMFEMLGMKCNLDVVFENRTESYRENEWLRDEFKNFNAIFLKGLKFHDLIFSTNIVSLVKRNNYDFIIIGVYSTPSQILTQMYLKIKKTPYILSSDGGFIKNEYWLKYWIKKYIISRANYWLCPSKNASDYLVHYGADRRNVFLYPFSSVMQKDILKDPDDKATREIFKKKNNIKEKHVVLYVGQIIHRKGIDVLIKAAKKLNDVGIYVIGGKSTDEYQHLIEKLEVQNVHFIEFKTRNQLADYYRASDVFVLPTREDIWGLVVNEAMAFGLPVITTLKCNAGLEMVTNDETGSLVNCNNEDELVHAIEYWIEKRDLNIDGKVLQVARHYTIENSAQRHYEIFDEIREREKCK